MSDTSGNEGDGPSYPAYGSGPPNQPPNQPPPYQGSQPPAYPTMPAPGSPQGQPPPYGSPTPPYGTGPPAYGSPPPAYGGGQQPPAYGGGQQPPAYPGGYGYGGEPQGKTGKSGLAIAALLVAILLPLVGFFIAVPLAIVALVKMSKSRQTGKWFAISGIVISVLYWVGFVLLVVFVLTSTAKRDSNGVITEKGRLDFGDIRVGDCVDIADLSGDSEIGVFDLQGVPCSDAHNAEAGGIVDVAGSDFPGDSALKEKSRACIAKFHEYVGDADKSTLLPYPVYPTEGIWDGDNGHRIVCFITQDDFSDTNSPIGK